MTPVPPAPWTCRAEATLWWRVLPRRGRQAVRAVLPPEVLAWGAPAVAVGALVRYLDTPVGVYREVLGGIGLLRPGPPGVHVPFIAVDSDASLVAGRANWCLPKTRAEFADGSDRSVGGGAGGGAWRITAAPLRSGPAVPAVLRGLLVQQQATGAVVTASLAGNARLRPCRVDVAVSGEVPGGVMAWFPTGRHWGAVLDAGTVTVAPGEVRRSRSPDCSA